eukprot:scaffold191_cov273-Chaetoceros_neogracile.AAC.8
MNDRTTTPSAVSNTREPVLASLLGSSQSTRSASRPGDVNLQGNGTLKFSPKQIAYLVSRHKAEKIVHNFKGEYQSSAEKLIAAFDSMIEQNVDIVYVAMIHSKDDEYLLKTSKGRPQKVSKQTDLNIEEVRKSMSINNNQSVLLAFAWITGDELRMLERFPELITFDVTEKTNNEKRSLNASSDSQRNP